MIQMSDPSVQELLSGRYIASLATESADRSIHMVAVWYHYDGQSIYIATSSRSRKARNLQRSPKASLMIDARNPAAQRGICISGTIQLLEGAASRDKNAEVHRKYLSGDALLDPNVGPVFAGWDDVTIQIVPHSVIRWDMREVDQQAFGGAFHKHPGYLLPVES